MKVMWVSLVEFPPLAKKLGHSVPPSCGWLYASAKAALSVLPEMELGVMVYSYGRNYEKHIVDGISYYLIPCKKMTEVDSRQTKFCEAALADFMPSLLHIHGTEYSLAAAACRANSNKVPSVVNIQGLAGPYERYADGGLSYKEQLFNITPLDFYRGTFIMAMRRRFRKRAKCENEVLRAATDIVGRTSWDRDHVLSINPELHYHFMNETLRESFYNEPHWNINTCKRHSIFVSNSGSPLKGAHQVLKALPIVLRKFPDARVRFCGSSVMNSDVRSLIHLQGYHLYLRKLVKRLGLENHVEFLGALSESEMKQAFLDANVFVLPSAIENSPNSLGEAQILGVPAIASYAGGIPDFINDSITGFLYRYEEIEMLAQRIIELFSKDDLSSLSDSEHKVASGRHNPTTNASRLKEIYTKILTDA